MRDTKKSGEDKTIQALEKELSIVYSRLQSADARTVWIFCGGLVLGFMACFFILGM